MKTKVSIVILALMAVALGIALISLKQQADKQHNDDVDKYVVISNQLNDVTGKWDDQKQVNSTLQKDLDAGKEAYLKLSNTLTQTTESLDKTQASLRAQQEETAARDAKIAELTAQNTDREKQLTDLQTSISKLEGDIADKQKQLVAAEGDKTFLTKELNRLMAQKANLERQFNDLALVRTQYRKLREEAAIAQRMEWIRDGRYASQDEKGAQRLMTWPLAHKAAAFSTPAAKPAVTNMDLNVEVNSDGTVKVIPPLSNPPPAAPPARQ
jgi:chromosome segregation ATPase